jgi:hypothetical protein
LLQTTQYPLPASAGIWADGFWQIVSIKETNNLSSAFQGRVFIPRPFFVAANAEALSQGPSTVFSLTGPAPTGAPYGRSRAIYHFWAVKPRRSGRGYEAGLSESVILNFFRPQDLWAGSAKVKPLSFSSAEVKRLWEEPSEEIRVKPTRTP